MRTSQWNKCSAIQVFGDTSVRRYKCSAIHVSGHLYSAHGGRVNAHEGIGTRLVGRFGIASPSGRNGSSLCFRIVLMTAAISNRAHIPCSRDTSPRLNHRWIYCADRSRGDLSAASRIYTAILRGVVIEIVPPRARTRTRTRTLYTSRYTSREMPPQEPTLMLPFPLEQVFGDTSVRRRLAGGTCREC